MSVSYTVDTLVDKVRVKGAIPTADDYLTDAQIITTMTDVLQTYVAPLIKTQMQEHMVTVYDQDFDPTQTTYSIPSRGMASSLRDICFVDSSNNEINIPLLNPDILKGYSTFLFSPVMWGYYLQNNSVIMAPQGNTAMPNYPTLRMKYYRRPNALVAEASAGQITAINTTTGQVTLASAPTTWTTSTTFDIIKGTPEFETRGDDLAISNITGFVLTFSDLPTGVAVGDWVCVAGESTIPQIPVEAFNLLVQSTTAACLEFMGDPRWTASEAQANKYEKKLVAILAPRVDGTPQTIVSRSWW